MHARMLLLAGALAAMAAPSAWSQQNATDAETAAREAAATAAIEAQVAQAQAQAAQEQARVDQARAQVAQAEVQIQAAQQEMESARAQLERAAREVAIQTRRAAVTVDENGLIRFNGGPGTPWVTYFRQGTRAQLGASLSDAEDGAQVTAITPGSGAADAGLQVGDVIRSIDGVDLATANELPAVEVINRLAAIEPGATVELVVARAGAELDIDVVTQEGQSSPFVFNTGSGQQVYLRTDRTPRLGQLYAERAEGAGGRGGQVVVTTDGSLESLGSLEGSLEPLRSLDTIRLFNWTGAPWGDMELVAITPELGRYFQTTEGLLVVRAPSDDAVGLQDGDVILTIGGRTPTSAEHAIRILGSFEPGEVIEFSLMRDGRREPLEYTVEESNFRFISPTVIGVAPPAAPAAPAPGARGRGGLAPAPAESVTPTSP